jgi:hypothetical protein
MTGDDTISFYDPRSPCEVTPVTRLSSFPPGHGGHSLVAELFRHSETKMPEIIPLKTGTDDMGPRRV